MKYHKLPKFQRDALNVYVKLMRATNVVTNRIHRHLAQDNLTLSQFAVLEALYHLGPLSQSQLGEKILKSNANLTTVVDTLEKKGLVVRKRSETDRRKVTVHLTDSGRTVIAIVFLRHAEVVSEEFGFLSYKEKNQLTVLLKRFQPNKE
jgi:MarR family 2-MHQ and catechol resistance regulon transcriptional repressor